MVPLPHPLHLPLNRPVGLRILSAGGGLGTPLQQASVFENTYFSFFSDFKKHDFLRFFEMT